MNWHFDKEIAREIRTYIEQHCSDINEIWTYITEIYESYWKAGEYDRYQTVYHIRSYINKQNHIKGLMTAEEVKEYLQSLDI